MITANFHINLKVDYAFQYRYRSKSISFFFRKEFAIALVMLCFFQYFNYLYLVLFRGNLDYVLEVISPVLNENEEPVMENGEVVM